MDTGCVGYRKGKSKGRKRIEGEKKKRRERANEKSTAEKWK